MNGAVARFMPRPKAKRTRKRPFRHRHRRTVQRGGLIRFGATFPSLDALLAHMNDGDPAHVIRP